MTVNLASELQEFVDDQVRIGRFASPEEVLSAALMRLRDEDVEVDEFDDEDLAALDEAEQDIAAGRVRPWNEVAAELRRKCSGT